MDAQHQVNEWLAQQLVETYQPTTASSLAQTFLGKKGPKKGPKGPKGGKRGKESDYSDDSVSDDDPYP